MSIRPLTRFLVSVGCLTAIAPVSAQIDIGPRRVGEIQSHSLSTQHPYVGGLEHVFEIRHPGATYIKVHFERFELAAGDRLIVSNPSGTESYVFSGRGYKDKGEDFWVTSVIGDTAVLRLQSTHSSGAFGFDVDYYAYGIANLFPPPPNTPESVCGTDDSMDVECYALTHPTEYDRAKRAVVVLYNGVENCTGLKIGCPNQIMSNEHCITDQTDVDATEVRFEFQRPGCASGTATSSVAYLGDQFQQDNFTLDYVVFTVEGVSDAYEAVKFDPRLPPVGERIYISGHPAGNPKKLTIEDSGSPTGLCRVDVSPTNGYATDTDIGYFCDTLPGSSGSPVWSGVTHKVIGLHHFGGCANSAVRIDLIHPQISALLMSCCTTPPEIPTIGVAVNGDNQIDVSWDDSDLAGVIEYAVKRSRTSGGPYETIATVADTSMGSGDGAPYSYSDTGVSGSIEYFYVVESTDGIQCTSDPSAEASAIATGPCTLGPVFSGVQTVSAPASSICALDIAWDPATPECGGPVVYNVHRATSSSFAPGPGNLIAGGLSPTAFHDTDQLVAGTLYFYKVRAIDTANGAQDGNNTVAGSLPAPGCITVSECAENPLVDVVPNGPQTVCQDGGPTLSANLSGGTGPFHYQWIRDGVPIPGATTADYTPNDPGTSSYNVHVRADTCPDVVFDGVSTELTRVDRPFFGGLESALVPPDPTCTVDLTWSAASSVCPGPIDYVIYRDTTVPVTRVPDNIVAGGLSGPTYSDVEALMNGQTYFYNVQARDASTGQFDGNAVDLSATPEGPNNGIQDAYLEDFSDAMVINDWTITTGPGPHSCGAWAIGSDPLSAPVQSSGDYLIADNRCSPLLPRTSTTATSPPIDLVIADLQSVMLTVNVRFDYSAVNTHETGAIEVWDGAQWIALWNSTTADVNQQMMFDVTAHAANNSGFRVRFDYQDANLDNFFSVDDVTVTTDVLSNCDTEMAGPLPIAAGSLAVGRGPGANTTVDLAWNAGACPTTDYNLLYGDLNDVAGYTLGGSKCSIGTSGSYSWTGVPGGNLYFLLVGTDAATTESSWGQVDGFGQRNGTAASNQCGVSSKDVTGVCPD